VTAGAVPEPVEVSSGDVDDRLPELDLHHGRQP